MTLRVLMVSFLAVGIVSLVEGQEDVNPASQSAEGGYSANDRQEAIVEAATLDPEVLSPIVVSPEEASSLLTDSQAWIMQLPELQALLSQLGLANPPALNDYSSTNPMASHDFSSPVTVVYDPKSVNPLAQPGVRQVIDNPYLDCPPGQARDINGHCRQLW